MSEKHAVIRISDEAISEGGEGEGERDRGERERAARERIEEVERHKKIGAKLFLTLTRGN